jgi:acetyltransferase-like isoleucine patch superfamily enzyme
MTLLPLRALADRPITTVARHWLDEIGAAVQDPSTDRPALCRRVLTGLWYPQYAGNWETAVADPALPAETRLALASADPRNITLEPEYYAECDDACFQRVKPLLWLWYSFDRTALAAQNVWLGVELRRILARGIFKRCGENFKCFHNTEFSFGYNMEVGDNVVVHRHVLLDDRGGIVLGNRVSISDYENIYSHTHSIVEQKDVTNATTIIDDGVRITYHATVLAGVRVREQQRAGRVTSASLPREFISVARPTIRTERSRAPLRAPLSFARLATMLRPYRDFAAA